MQIEIEDGTIEDLIREALDGVDIVENVDVEAIVTDEIAGLDLLEGINVKELVRSAVKNAVEDSEDFNDFMKMRERVKELEETNAEMMANHVEILALLKSRSNLVDRITRLEEMGDEFFRRIDNRSWWKFWV